MAASLIRLRVPASLNYLLVASGASCAHQHPQSALGMAFFFARPRRSWHPVLMGLVFALSGWPSEDASCNMSVVAAYPPPSG